MANEETPKAEFTIETSQKEYTDASLLAARRNGLLHSLPLVVLIAAALLFIGLCSFSWFQSKYSSAFVPMLLCFGCVLLLLFFFTILPNFIKNQATVNFHTYQALMEPVTLRLYADNAVTESSCIKLTDSYALMSECIETPDMFVLIKDGERMLVIPKHCLPPDKSEEITSFLRLVFARHRCFMKNWIF